MPILMTKSVLVVGRKKSSSNRQDQPGQRRRYGSEESSGTFSSSDLGEDLESSISHQLHFELQQVTLSNSIFLLPQVYMCM